MYRQHPASSTRASRQRRGFTLVELLVVITIIAMLVGLLVPAVLAARGAARKSQCLNNQKQLATAMMNYITTKQKFPPAFSLQPDPMGVRAAAPRAMGWVPAILPTIEQNEFYRAIQSDTLQSQQSPVEIDILKCPARDISSSPAPLSYVVNSGAQDRPDPAVPTDPKVLMDYRENAVFLDEFSPKHSMPVANRPRPTPPVDLAFISDHDGAGKTIMLTENNDARDWFEFPAGVNPRLHGLQTSPVDMTPGQPGNGTDVYGNPNNGQSWWNSIVARQPPAPGPPANWGTASDTTTSSILRNSGAVSTAAKTDNDNARPSSNHSGGFHLTFCDGRVQFTSEEIEYRVYCLLISPNGGEAKVANSISGGNPGDLVVYPTPWYASGTQQLIPLTDAELNP